MTPVPLLSDQPITQKGELPSRDLVEIIQRLVATVKDLQARIDGLADIAAPTGGGTIDAEARTAINAIRGI